MTPGEPERPGFATPQEAAFGDFPPQYVEILGSVVDGDHATVWMLTNEAPDFEAYTVFCERQDGLWYDGCGVSGLNYDVRMPDEVYERASSLGYED